KIPILQSTAIIILGHGSPVSKANNTLHEVAKSVKEKGSYDIVQPAFLQFEHPDFSEAVDLLVKQGAKKIIVHPYFLYMGSHVTKDLPFEIGTAEKKYPNLEFVLAPHLGYHEKLVDVAIERIEQIMGRLKPCPAHHSPNQHPIEAESFKIIGEQLDESRFDAMELPIVKRLVHTTADFEYADLVRFGNNAIEAGIDAISKGADIITDVRMVEVGISRERFNKFGGQIRCFVADADVIAQAQKDNITKTAAAMQKALGYMDSSIVVIGNAPTALLKLIKMIKEEKARPAVVIGVPVGFVGAEESKEELMKLDLPYISIKGKKGGSTVAVAIVNALLMMADGKHAHP
ncbi:MAG TPA: precorrin-8X methylmutase, partial [Thermodesulfobacteriota bacterium]|nr:precorrin-8X methylmutase [Thermodesulfobacteriota bacterium]